MRRWFVTPWSPFSSPAARAIIQHCQTLTANWLAEFGHCASSDDLLQICAQKTGTQFVILTSNADLARAIKQWPDRGESQFATIEREFERGVVGITFRLRNAEPWQLPFVSVIDARGERGKRAWFTKWQELGHLLILDDRNKNCFCRTHTALAVRDPEELLVDRIAGACGFHPALILAHFEGPLTLNQVEVIRRRICPDSSIQASRIGIVAACPSPCVLLKCAPDDRRPSHARGLKVLSASPNEAAMAIGLTIPPNSPVPQGSVINGIFQGRKCEPRTESLEGMTTSACRLSHRMFLVSADGRPGQTVIALITPDLSTQNPPLYKAGAPETPSTKHT